MLSLVFDAGTLDELKAGDLIFDKGQAAGDQAPAAMFDDERGTMERRGMSMPAEQQHANERSHSQEREPQPSRCR